MEFRIRNIALAGGTDSDGKQHTDLSVEVIIYADSYSFVTHLTLKDGENLSIEEARSNATEVVKERLKAVASQI